ncbi:NAD(P)-dependent oxidoreductase [Streptomyces caniscabiei]|uniref:NAD(P)-dependent oxidoreductase n=1 Tax=Streptomyces caniscabiei TaxID=2746961 RepID=A0ABU4MU32_9ACTN|nr:NAD(P)-dependent oxidoreductase [Streptomyces caniscabiei]MBE4737611.1 NAD(P)-dependent oxidoreductase [Streptomyces caniscabiei]MBE4756371.1 NAD(P)-dependent oxidoreductase [Streptomyces caniscabiei]MBE4769613.1 NAD(P)-dependent oxidoreductase [Streptomyces caniscabiei]MBE4787442.1 NAD(P)-dependent oxidoreductase [Streptomyces caniscabiei]MBE4795153.1 NAD(P)-dependent oxidoreductase [Streptomyces caniscabiei]
MTTIGFIGLGNMGFPMAQRLVQAGHALIVHDHNTQAVEKFLAAHSTAATAGTATWQRADIIITMLPTSAIVEAALLTGQVVAAASLNTLFIDMSSAEPSQSQQLAVTLEKKGMRYVDAPVSGGVRGALNGQLAIMAGGTAADVREAKPLFEVMGKSLIHVGGPGSGHAAKALNNLVSAASVAVTVEALHIGQRFGIAPQTLTDVLNASSGRSNTSENKVTQFMLSGSFRSGFPIGLMTKDVDIAIALSEELGVDAELSHHCADVWHQAVDNGFAAEDHTRMYEILDRPDTTPRTTQEGHAHA